MDQTTFLYIFAGGLGLIAFVFAGAAWFHRQRSRFLRRAGQRLGLTPIVAGESFHFTPVALLRKKGRGIGAALRGIWQGHQIAVFDLFHPIGQSMAMQTVLMVELNDGRLPEFAALAHNPRLLAPPMDIRPVDPVPAELATRWNLYTRNGRWSFDTGLDRWLAQSGNGDWSFEGTGHVLYVYRRSTTASTRNLRRWLDEALRVAGEFSRHASTAPPTAEPHA